VSSVDVIITGKDEVVKERGRDQVGLGVLRFLNDDFENS
jgi:hypothetical protein